MDKLQDPTVQHYIQYPVINHNGKEYEKEHIYIYMYMYNRINLQQKLTQHYKSTAVQ